MIFPILGAIITKSIMEIFFNNLLINTSFSLIITRLNLVNNALSSLAFIQFSQIEFYFKLYTLKSPISIIFFMIILF